MLNNIFFKTIRDNSRSLVFWAIGLIALGALMAAFYPSVKESSAQLTTYLENMPPALKGFIGEQTNYATPQGYLTGELFSFTLPIIFFIYTISFGVASVAGEEEKGTLDLILANPIPRWRLIIEKFLAMLVCTFALFAITYLGLVVTTKISNMSFSLTNLAQAMFALYLLSIAFGTIALAVGAAAGKSGLGIGITATLIVASFFLNALAPIVKVLKDYREFSPYYHYFGNDPLNNGVKLASLAVFIWIIIVFLVVSIFVFRKRDLEV